MKAFIALFACLMTLSVSIPIPAWADLSARQVLERVDFIRNPQQDYTVHVRITSHRMGKDPDVAEYEVLIKGRSKTLVKTLAPPIDRGTSMLMLGYDMWVFMPSISKPLRISLQQRLLGEVAYGDIARANFSGDYEPTVSGRESLGGVPCVVLDLKALDERVTYQAVRLWAAEKDYRPLKAEFYAASGKLLKTCIYEDYQDVQGVQRPVRLVLQDALKRGSYSIMEYSNVHVAPLPDMFFNQRYLKNLKY